MSDFMRAYHTDERRYRDRTTDTRPRLALAGAIWLLVLMITFEVTK